MSYAKKTVTKTGYELDFIKGFINELTSSDEKIICKNYDTLDEQFSVNTNFPYFVINVLNTVDIKFTRRVVLSNGMFDYTITTDINGATVSLGSINISQSSYVINYNTINTRSCSFFISSNDNTVILYFSSYGSTTYDKKIAILKNDIFSAIAYALSSSINLFNINNKFYCIDIDNSGKTILPFNRLPYIEKPGNIEIYENKIFIDSVVKTNKFADCIGLNDCSTVAPDQIIEVDGEKYYTVSSNTIMRI